MKNIGADVKFANGRSTLADSPLATLDVLAGIGFQGILVRTLDEAFPTLDAVDIREFACAAESLGMFVQVGVGKVNPYMTAELPRVRDLGHGSYVAGMERMIEVCAEHGWCEAWTATGGYKQYPGRFAFDRFRTDVSWSEQLAGTGRLIERLAPLLRSHGVRLNLETHEEITTFELARLVGDAGVDVLGVCLDPANVMVRGESVPEAVARVADVTHMTHLRDVIVVPAETGISRFLAPLGEGVIEWVPLLETVLRAQPDVELVIEGIGGSRAEMTILPDDPEWLGAHPDLVCAEIKEVVSLAAKQEEAILKGQAPSLNELRAAVDRRSSLIDFLGTSLDNLRMLLSENVNIGNA